MEDKKAIEQAIQTLPVNLQEMIHQSGIQFRSAEDVERFWQVMMRG